MSFPWRNLEGASLQSKIILELTLSHQRRHIWKETYSKTRHGSNKNSQWPSPNPCMAQHRFRFWTPTDIYYRRDSFWTPGPKTARYKTPSPASLRDNFLRSYEILWKVVPKGTLFSIVGTMYFFVFWAKKWGFCLQIPLFLLPWWSLRNARVLLRRMRGCVLRFDVCFVWRDTLCQNICHRGQEPQKSRDVVKLSLFQVWIFHWVLVTQPQQEI